MPCPALDFESQVATADVAGILFVLPALPTNSKSPVLLLFSAQAKAVEDPTDHAAAEVRHQTPERRLFSLRRAVAVDRPGRMSTDPLMAAFGASIQRSPVLGCANRLILAIHQMASSVMSSAVPEIKHEYIQYKHP